MISDREAKKEFFAYFLENWEDGLANGLANSNPVLPASTLNYTPKVYFPDIEERNHKPTKEHFVRVNLYNIQTSQRSLPGGRANGGGVKFTTPGVGIVQLFFSRHTFATADKELLTAIVHEMLLGKSTDNIWFRNPTIKDLPPEETHFRSDVDFEYTFDTHIRCPV